MVSVVVLHAAIPYGQFRLPSLLWAVHDHSTHWVFDLIFWGCLSVSMPVFFVLGGYFAARSLATHGLRYFARDRLARVVRPFVLGILLVLPAMYVVWGLGWMKSGLCTPSQLMDVRFGDPYIRANYHGPGHLWFLEYLAIWLLILAVIRLIRPGETGGFTALVSRLRDRRVLLVWTILPTSVWMLVGQLTDGLDPVLHMPNSLWPHPIRLVHHGWFFLVGVMLGWIRFPFQHLAIPPLGGGLAWLAAFTVRCWLVARAIESPEEHWEAVLSSVLGAFVGWWGALCLLCWCSTYVLQPLPRIRRLADGSFWIYLWHLPLVGLVQVNWFLVPAPLVVKWLSASLIGLWLPWLVYSHAEQSWLVLALNGAWNSTGPTSSKTQPSSVGVPAPKFWKKQSSTSTRHRK